MNFYQRKRRTPTVIIVSLIDIFVILLIFVIVTSTFKRAQPAVSIKLPESSAAASDAKPEERQPVTLTISAEGKVFLGEREIPVGPPLVQALRETAANHQSLALNADTKAPFGVFIRLLDALKEAGIKGNLQTFTETIDRKTH